jgi:hypothetical protein
VLSSFPGVACVGHRNSKKIVIGVADGSEDRAMYSSLRDFGGSNAQYETCRQKTIDTKASNRLRQLYQTH